jgi:arabinogalactan oligomer/maltooligosaccharide transport system permease protein
MDEKSNSFVDKSEQNLSLDQISNINQTFVKDPWYLTLAYSLLDSLKKLGLWLLDFIIAVGKSLIGIFIGIYKGAVGLVKWSKKFYLKQKEYFQESDLYAKLSYGFMGVSHIKHGQIYKGIIYILAEILFIVFMIFYGGRNLHKLLSLGDQDFQEGQWDGEGFSDPIQGDNSIKCLLYGIITIMVIVLFISLYFHCIKSSNRNCRVAYNIQYRKAYNNALHYLKNYTLLDKCLINIKGEDKYLRGKKLITLLQNEYHLTYLDALILSRSNFDLLEKGEYDLAYQEMKLSYDAHCHTYDKYNIYYDQIETKLSLIKGIENFALVKRIIEENVNKKGKLDKKEAVCQLVNELDIVYENASLVYDEIKKHLDDNQEQIAQLLKNHQDDLTQYEANHQEKMDSHLYSFKKEIGTYLDEKFSFTIMLLPTLMCTLIVILPLFFTFFIAFTNFDGMHNYPNRFTWVGFENVSYLFVSQGSGAISKVKNTVWTLLGWTIIWAIFATFLNYIFGMILALLINKKGIKGKAFFRTLFVLTIAIPSFISLTSMAKLLSDTGAVNSLIYQYTGTKFAFLDTSNITQAKITIIIVNLWIGIPYTMLQTSGILMNIPEDLYESAKIDGAGPFTQFMKITLPYMLFVTGPSLITQFVGNINNFNVIYFLTGGITVDPSLYKAKKTDLLITWLYSLATGADQKYNIASVIGIFIFVVCAFFSLIFYSKSSAVKNEEDFQ